MSQVTLETSGRSEIEEQWRSLDPIFIMGRQRTGTSVMWWALRVAGFYGFPEGHLWFDLVDDFVRWRDPGYRSDLRKGIFTLGSGRNLVLEKRFALMIDQFHRDLLPPDLVRWVDKSPGVSSVRLAPMLAELFPQSQFIFMLRNPITTVNSAIHYLSRKRDPAITGDPTAEKSLHVFRVACERWVGVMEIWRQVRSLLTERYIEVAQEHIVEVPDKVARRLAGFLGIPQFTDAIADVFKSQRANTAFPDKDVSDFLYPVSLTGEQRAMLTEICQDEMAVWGYPLDFQRPGGPDPALATDSESGLMDMAAYCRWPGHRSELAEYKELLARVSQGRVMRVLNKVDQLLRRFGVRQILEG